MLEAGPGARTLPWDWYPGAIPENVVVDDHAFVETTFSFHLYRSEAPVGVRYGPGSATYLGTMFDVGPRGQVTLGECALVHGARFICDTSIAIGDFALISWNTVFMDSYRVPRDTDLRRAIVQEAARRADRFLSHEQEAAAIRVERNVWVGFEACVLPGVTIGEGSIVGAKSVVFDDVPPFTVVAGNPARVIRSLTQGARRDAR